ncbi:MAG: ABC transporter substrate-binding protein [Bacillaceae bacterium]
MKKRISAALSIALVGSMALTACGKDDDKASTTPKQGSKDAAKQVLNLAASSEIPSLDSGKTTDSVSFEVLTNVMEGLYRLDKDNKPTPGMAEKVDVSEDKKTYTFHLRDAKWSNGDPVTAKDFVYAWQRNLSKELAAEYAFILYYIKNAEKVNTGKAKPEELGAVAKDDKTLVVELEKPCPYFLELTTFGTYFPINEKIVKEKGEKFALEAENTVYNGPFKLTEWKHEEGWKMEKNDTYWDKDTVKLEEINVKVIKDQATAVNLYDTGKLDRTTLKAEFIDKYRSTPEFKTVPDSRLYFIRYNQKNKVFANQKVRQAINLAYDKEGITGTLLNDGSIPGYFLVPKAFVNGPDGKDFRDANGDLYKTNVAEAKKLWEEAKKELGQKEITVKMLNYDDDTSKKVGAFIQEELQKNLPGLKVEAVQQPFKQKLDLEKKQNYEFSLSGWGPDYPDPMTFVDMFETKSPFNEMSYSNPKYDELVNKSRGELLTDPDARWKALQEAEKILLDDAAISPMYQRGIAYVQKPYVKDIYKHNFGGDYSYKWAYIEK